MIKEKIKDAAAQGKMQNSQTKDEIKKEIRQIHSYRFLTQIQALLRSIEPNRQMSFISRTALAYEMMRIQSAANPTDHLKMPNAALDINDEDYVRYINPESLQAENLEQTDLGKNLARFIRQGRNETYQHESGEQSSSPINFLDDFYWTAAERGRDTIDKDSIDQIFNLLKKMDKNTHQTNDDPAFTEYKRCLYKLQELVTPPPDKKEQPYPLVFETLNQLALFISIDEKLKLLEEISNPFLREQFSPLKQALDAMKTSDSFYAKLQSSLSKLDTLANALPQHNREMVIATLQKIEKHPSIAKKIAYIQKIEKPSIKNLFSTISNILVALHDHESKVAMNTANAVKKEARAAKRTSTTKTAKKDESAAAAAAAQSTQCDKQLTWEQFMAQPHVKQLAAANSAPTETGTSRARPFSMFGSMRNRRHSIGARPRSSCLPDQDAVLQNSAGTSVSSLAGDLSADLSMYQTPISSLSTASTGIGPTSISSTPAAVASVTSFATDSLSSASIGLALSQAGSGSKNNVAVPKFKFDFDSVTTSASPSTSSFASSHSSDASTPTGTAAISIFAASSPSPSRATNSPARRRRQRGLEDSAIRTGGVPPEIAAAASAAVTASPARRPLRTSGGSPISRPHTPGRVASSLRSSGTKATLFGEAATRSDSSDSQTIQSHNPCSQ